MGKIFNVEDRAEALVAEMRATVAKGQEYASKAEPKNIVIIEDEGDAFRVYGEDTIGVRLPPLLVPICWPKPEKSAKAQKIW